MFNSQSTIQTDKIKYKFKLEPTSLLTYNYIKFKKKKLYIFDITPYSGKHRVISYY